MENILSSIDPTIMDNLLYWSVDDGRIGLVLSYKGI